MPPLIRCALALSIFVSAAAIAADTLEITPSSPDSTQTINIKLTGVRPDRCVPADPRVSIEKRTIVVQYRNVEEICLSVSTPYTTLVNMGPLTPGLYTVIAMFGNETVPLAEASLTVRDAGLPFRLFPHAVSKTTGGTVVLNGVRGAFCESGIPDCDKREVFFGDKAAIVPRVIDFSSSFVAIAPPQDAEVVDVTIKYPNGTSSTARAAFRYFDPAAPPDPALFERILLPVTRDVRGAFGSDFRVSLTVYNDNSYDVPLWRPIGEAGLLPGSAQTTLSSDKPNGALIFPLRTSADRLYFASNARDVSRVSETFGTEVRVVRNKDARVGHSELVNVPADPNFRLGLRLYGIDSIDGWVLISIHSPDNRILYGDAYANLHAPSNEEPAFAFIGDLRAAFPGLQTITSGSFRIHFQGQFGLRYWPLLTVTNNTTQQITTMTPQ